MKLLSIDDITEECVVKKEIDKIDCVGKIEIRCKFMLGCNDKVYCKVPIIFDYNKAKLYEQYLNQ